MRFARQSCAAALLALSAGPLLAQDSEAPAVPISQWAVETQFIDMAAGGAGNTVTRTFIAPGETAKQWTRQAKEVRLKSMAILLTPRDAALAAGERLKRSCPDAVIAAPSEHVIDGRKAVMQRADCPLNAKSGQPLVVISAGWNIDLDVQLKSVLFTYIPGPEDVALAEAFLLTPAAPVDWESYPARQPEDRPAG